MPDGRQSYNLFRRCALGALALPSLVACAPATPTPAPPVAPAVRVRDVFPDVGAACAVPRQRELSEPPPEIAPEERVPDFLLASESCEIFDSRELVGKRAVRGGLLCVLVLGVRAQDAAPPGGARRRAATS